MWWLVSIGAVGMCWCEDGVKERGEERRGEEN